jgi:ABC-type spermidine/putrescine transport system permease subunit II
MRAHLFLALVVGVLAVVLGLLLKEAHLGELFTKKAFWDALAWSLWLGFASVFLAFLVSIVSIYLPKTIWGLALFGIVTPPFLVGMGLTWFSIRFSLGQGALVLAHTLSVLPYMLFFFKLSYGRIDSKLKAQARLHSGNLWVQLRYFYLPVMAPSLGAGAAVGVSVSLAQYMLSLLLSPKPTLSTQMVPLLHSGQLGSAAAYGAIYVMLAPVVILVTAWAMKGELWRPYM